MIREVHLISIEDFYSSNQLFFIFQIFSSKVGLISLEKYYKENVLDTVYSSNLMTQKYMNKVLYLGLYKLFTDSSHVQSF